MKTDAMRRAIQMTRTGGWLSGTGNTADEVEAELAALEAEHAEMYEALDDLSSAADLLQAACECATSDERACVACVRTSLDTAIAALAKARGES